MILLAIVARVPAEGVTRYQAYEARVLPLLAEHGGRLERRLRTRDEQVEVHIVSFESAEALSAYVGDPQRAELAPLLARSGAEIELLEVEDVAVG